MKALAWPIGDKLVCARCALNNTQGFEALFFGMVAAKEVDATQKCAECGNEYGGKSATMAAEKIMQVLDAQAQQVDLNRG